MADNVMKKDGIYDRKSFREGKTFVEEGDIGYEAYLIQSGRVRVFTQIEGKEVDLAELGEGNIIGELALIMDEPRSASVQALSDVSVVVMTRQNFQQMMLKTDRTVQAVLKLLSQRLKTQNAETKDRAQLEEKEAKELALVEKEAINRTQELAKDIPDDDRRLLFMEMITPAMRELIRAVKTFKAKQIDEEFEMMDLDPSEFSSETE